MSSHIAMAIQIDLLGRPYPAIWAAKPEPIARPYVPSCAATRLGENLTGDVCRCQTLPYEVVRFYAVLRSLDWRVI